MIEKVGYRRALCLEIDKTGINNSSIIRQIKEDIGWTWPNILENILFGNGHSALDIDMHFPLFLMFIDIEVCITFAYKSCLKFNLEFLYKCFNFL